jgi:hypothetical protein
MVVTRTVAVTGVLSALLLAVSGWLDAAPWVAFLVWTGQGMLERHAGPTWYMLPAFAAGTLTAAASVMSANVLSAAASELALPLSLGAACACVALLNAWRSTECAVAPIFLGMVAWFGSAGSEAPPSLVALLVAASLGIGTHYLARLTISLRDRGNGRRQNIR